MTRPPLYQPIHAPCGAPARDTIVTAPVTRTDLHGRRHTEIRVVGRTVSCDGCGAAESYPVRPGRRVG